MTLPARITDARTMLAQSRLDVHACRLLQAELIEEAREVTAEGVLDDAQQASVEVAIDLARELRERHAAQQRRDNQAALDDAERDRQQGIRNGFHPQSLRGVDPGSGGNWRSSPLPTNVGLALAGKTMAQLFGPPRERSRWDSASQFYQAIQSGLSHPHLIPFQAAMGEGSGISGGFLVPEELAFAILDEALHQEIVRPRATVTPMISRTKLVPSYDGSNQSALSQMYGMTFSWLEESEQVQPGQARVRAIELVARLAGIYLAASNELAADAPGFEEDLSSRIIVSVAENLDYAFLNGDGVSKPLGVLKSPARFTVAPESAQQGGSIVWNNLTKMFSRSTNQAGAVWITNPQTLPQLLSLTIAVGTAGGSYLPVVTIGPNGEMTLLTRPLLLSSKMPLPGQEGDIAFCDFSAYWIGLRKEVGLERSAHVGFLRNESTWRALVRVDGQPKINQPYVGPDQQEYSPFVTLASRP